MSGQIENVSRRRFLKNLGISSTALVIGVQLPGLSLMPKALAASSDNSVFEPSVYLQISQDNTVSVIVHRSEMGQGIRTSIPMIVADELEADWQQVKVIQGLGDKKYGSQNTDGSRSIRRFYQPLREAGASARMMLEQAAANIWQVPVAQCQAQNGHVVDKAGARQLAFGDLVVAAQQLPLPEKDKIVFKAKQDFNFIGKENVALVDGHDIATGKAVYGYDVQLPEMKIAVIARPPVLASKIKSYDDSAAKKVPGVIAVVKMPDVEEPVLFKPLGGIAVIATNTWAALQGRKALKIDWQVNQDHQTYNSDSYKAALNKSCDNPAKVLRQKGDFTKALADADQELSAEYYVPELIHAPMEPPAATAHYHDGQFDIWACTQTPQSAQNTVAQFMQVEPEKVNVNVTLLGGGFGRKSKPDFIVEAAYLAKTLMMPIKVEWSREDEVQQGYYHAVSYQKLRAGLKNKTLTAWQHNVALPPIGSTFSKGADLIGSESGLGLVDMPYQVANVSCAAGKAPAHTRIGWLRSVTNINQAFAVCSFADELAHARDLDPVQNLLSLLGDDRLIDLTKEQTEYGNYGESTDVYPIDTARLKNVVNRVAELANWSKPRPKNHGLGIAVHRSFVSYVASVVEVSVNPQGKIKLEHIWLSVDCGIAVNPERIKSQMEGAAVFAISLAYYGELTAKNGVIEQGNFDTYQMARIGEVPETTVDIVDSDAPPGGVGEPGVPPIVPALTNAIFAATGKRYRELPLKQYDII